MTRKELYRSIGVSATNDCSVRGKAECFICRWQLPLLVTVVHRGANPFCMCKTCGVPPHTEFVLRYRVDEFFITYGV